MSTLNVGTVNVKDGLVIPRYTTAGKPSTGVQNGQIIYNTDTFSAEVYYDGSWYTIGGGIQAADGGTVTEASGYYIHTFTSDGTFKVNIDPLNVEFLVIGGGGGGAGTQGTNSSGGGGGGGRRGDLRPHPRHARGGRGETARPRRRRGVRRGDGRERGRPDQDEVGRFDHQGDGARVRRGRVRAPRGQERSRHHEVQDFGLSVSSGDADGGSGATGTS